MPPTNQSTPRQQSFPGIEPEHPEVDYRIERWLEHKAAAEEAQATATAADEAVAQAMLEHGVPYRAYTDPKSGKRKYRYVDRSPRLKSVAARPEAGRSDEASVSESVPMAPVVSDASDRRAPVDEVTHRRVPRARVEAELAAIAEETRRADDRDVSLEQGNAAIDGALRPARLEEDEEAADEAAPVVPEHFLELYETPEVAQKPFTVAAGGALVERDIVPANGSLPPHGLEVLESEQLDEPLIEIDAEPSASVGASGDARECGNTHAKMGRPCSLSSGHDTGDRPTMHTNGRNSWKTGQPRRQAGA